jgi:hypothetical protein
LRETVIIDCHTHIFPDEVRGNREAFCQEDEGFASIYRNSKAKMAGAEDLIRSMDESGVMKSVVCGFSWGRADLCALHNEYLMKSALRYPDRLIVFISLLPAEPGWSEGELERRVRDGAKGVGEIAFYRRAMRPRDIHLMKPILKRMENERIPLLLHTNERLGHDYPGKGTTPVERFYDLILAFPDLPIVLAHWGGGLPFYELMPEVAGRMAHVYYDTAASPFLYSNRIYPAVAGIVGPKRILFGTDFPLLAPRRYFDELEASGLSEEDRRKILGLNLLGLLESQKEAGR